MHPLQFFMSVPRKWSHNCNYTCILCQPSRKYRTVQESLAVAGYTAVETRLTTVRSVKTEILWCPDKTKRLKIRFQFLRSVLYNKTTYTITLFWSEQKVQELTQSFSYPKTPTHFLWPGGGPRITEFHHVTI